ncbi:DNA cytosine methyltransferase [Aliterella atlantica]|uniref:Cytosine-specific methyltransferase n=1 Tax=Aliterella atlantica CENA595 TaxID=1618023 RepID=A0A0D8ZND0_9CYAN|nr:DNA cytosine methyltransferase [Aliterella atlantica]KJH70318.1 DNA methyltransferase [Aliterella atlantica CENA595]
MLGNSSAQVSLPTRRPVAVDLFAGAGGFSLGMEQAGFDVLVAVESDPVHAAVYKFNFPLTEVLCTSVSNLTGEAIKQAAYKGWKHHHPYSRPWNQEIDLVFGGPPCQGFSIMGKRLIDDDRNSLILEFCRLVIDLNPRYFVMENVPGMAAGKHITWLHKLKNKFKQHGYHGRAQILNAADFGIPQKRKRLFFCGAQAGMKVYFPQPLAQNLVTVADAIADLPDLDSFVELKTTDEVLLSKELLGQLEQKTSTYAKFLRSIPAKNNFAYPRLWNPQLLTSSMQTQHTENSIARFAATLANQREPISHLRRLDLHGLSHTLRAGTGSDRGSYTSPRPIHPILPRVISVREAARLHSFPDWFRFHQTKWHGFRQVGNAVPPLLAQAIGKKIIAALGITPIVPGITLAPGDRQLLSWEPSQAFNYWLQNCDRQEEV